MLHKIYESGGEYDISYFMSKIIISFVISHIIYILIKYIFLSERNIANIRKQETLSLANKIYSKEKKNLAIKYIIFFIAGIIFLGFFWFLLSSFGAVYQNTQIFIFKNALISFSFSLIYPFIINILACIFRIISLRIKTKNGLYLYKLSKFLQLL